MKEETKKINGNLENTQDMSNEPMQILRVFAESQCARFQSIIFWLCVIIGVLIACNVGQYVYYEYERSQFETVAIEADISTDGGGNANFIGKDGDITNGENKSKDDIS